MDLPNDSIGVSDLIDWQECARRMSYKMKRWGGKEPPEAAVNPTKLYGAAIHDAIDHMEKTACTPEEAVQHIMSNGHRWIDPEVISELIADLETHLGRDDPLDWQLVMNETEIRVPLMIHKGKQIYYRAKVDRLYRHRTIPGLYWLRDTKSTRWERNQKDVDEDKQMSAYDWSLRDYMPEIEQLRITYDQLRFGEVHSSRTDDDRRKIVRWLKMSATAVLDDEDYGPDDLLVPEFNNWCPYCPIMLGCPVVPNLTNYARAEIARIAPDVKEGRTVRADLDPDLFDVYVEQLPSVITAKGVLERFEKAVKARLMELPSAEREAYGFATTARNRDVFSAEALRAAHRLLGDSFYEVVSMSKEAVARAAGSDKDKLNLIIGMADRRPGNSFVVRKGSRRRSGPSRS